MVQNEQSNNINQSLRTAPTVFIPSSSLPMFQPTSGILSHKVIDNNAIDITSLKGQFAWEKIPLADTYMPVIFRGDTKYFCVRMLRKLLPDYPEDILRRSYQYHYKRPIDTYAVTACEVELLNRINSHHSRWAYSRQLFTALDEIVRVSDFLPFYEHLRGQTYKSSSHLSNITVHTLRQLLPQQHQIVQRQSDVVNNMPSILRTQSSVPVQTQSFTSSTDFSCDNMPSNLRPPAPSLNIPRPSRPSKSIGNPYAVVLPVRPSQYPFPQQQPSIVPVSNHTTKSVNTASFNNPVPAPVMTPTSTGSSSSSSLSSMVPLSTNTSPVPPSPSVLPLPPPPVPLISSTTLNRKSSTSSVSSSTTKSQLYSGWLQINKLYTPYVSTSNTNHHLYKIPVSLLSYYGLLKTPSTESNDSNECSVPFEQTVVTSQEIELINDLCIKQTIKPLAIDTKLITLSTFYKHFSANILFVKELPIHEPKASICKDWSTIVQINGGICRLRNTATLHEQTVPFIGNNLLKNFILSSKSLSTASLSKPTADELEFLQLILFFSNLTINTWNAQLVDIESVRKEYNVDLILLFNDKFPLNVLNYQEQGNRSNTSQSSVAPSNSTAPTNTIAESTPPPSPPSPPTATKPQVNNTAQLPLTSSGSRYYKTIQFHGHSLTAYVCSGLGTNTQRECVSIKSLCNILYPNSSSTDKLEIKMLRILRSKNINRFRPQNQQSMGLTRLIDIKDAEKHWDYIEQEMRAISNDNDETNIRSSISSVSTENSKASTVERVEVDKQSSSETSVEVNKGEKRPMDDEPFDEEDTPVLERINKRVKVTENENPERLTEISNTPATDNKQKKRTIKLTSTKNAKKRALPINRTNKQSIATWVRKYDIEDCHVLLNKYDPIYDTERE